MRDLIDEIVDGDNDKFANLMKAVTESTVFVFAQEEEEEGGVVYSFLNYVLEDEETIEYIPLFTDQDEVDEFVMDEEVPDGYSLYEFEGQEFADLMDPEQFLMLNPISGGIVFQGAHLSGEDFEEEGDEEEAGDDSESEDEDEGDDE
jgi:hypothetical protein